MIDPRVRAWWLFLCAVAAFNGAFWVWSWRRFRARPELGDRRAHLWLSGVYVLVCGFRGVFPRADVQRICLWDTWLSSVAVGRTVATVAELCCVVQWSLLAAEYGRSARHPGVVALSRFIVALICFAETCSWYSVLTRNYLGNTLEESSWTLMALSLAVGMFVLRRRATPLLKMHTELGMVGCAAYIAFMLNVDVAMYLHRFLADESTQRPYLSLADGWHDISTRWVVTWAWSDWSTEIAWMTLYFSAAVWVMVSLPHAPRWDGGAAPVRPG